MPQLFFEILGEPAAWGDNYEFCSVEIKQAAYRIDGIFTPKPHTAAKTVIFVEFQFQKDEFLYERLFSEIMLYLAQNLTAEDWRAIAVYPRRSIEQENKYRHRTLLQSEQFQAVYLEDFLGQPSEQLGIQLMQLIVAKEKDTQPYLDGLVRQLQGKTDPKTQAIIEMVSTIMVYKFPQLSRSEIEAMFTVSDLQQTKVYQEALTQGEKTLIIRQLNRKLGQIPPEQLSVIQNLPLITLEALGEALLDFRSPADLKAWLKSLDE